MRVDAALLREDRERDINRSAALERALSDALRQQRRERWLAGNRSAIAASNEQVEVYGALPTRCAASDSAGSVPQLAVHRNRNAATTARFPLLLDVQSGLLEQLGTLVRFH